MKYLKRYLEVIKVPIKVGDTVLGGRFKNRKTVVKKIGKNDKGDITINNKPLLKYRIIKEHINDIYDFVEGKEYEYDDLPEETKKDIDLQFEDNIEESPKDYVWEYKLMSHEEVGEFVTSHWGEFELDDQIEDEYVQSLIEDIEKNGIKLPAVGSEGNHRALACWELGIDLPYLEPILKEDINESRISVFSQDWGKLLPKKLTLVTSTGKWEMEHKDMAINGDLLQILYYHNTPEKSGDVNSDGEPDTLEFDIHMVKDNDGTHANPDKLRLNIDITYGDAMVSEFTIEAPNITKAHHYTSVHSLYDPETMFAFSDDSISDLVKFFNRFDNKFKLTPKDFTFLDSDPDSYQPS